MAARGQAFAVGQQMAGIGQQLILAVTDREFVQAAVADRMGSALCGQIAAAFIGRAHIAQDQLQHGFKKLAGLIELDRRDDDALLVQLGGEGQGAGGHAADIGMVGAAGCKEVGPGRAG